ncbi:MAG: FG-GAP-like repeat-containing protein [Actinomycetota bacterium]
MRIRAVAPAVVAFALVASVGVAAVAPGAAATQPSDARRLFSRMALVPAANGHRSVLADMNGDGRQDLVTAVGSPTNTPVSWGVSVMTALPGGGFAPGVVTNTENPVDTIQVLDIDGDGDLDVAAGQIDKTTLEPVGVVVLQGFGEGSLDEPLDTGLPPSAFAFGHFQPGRPVQAVASTDEGLVLFEQPQPLVFTDDQVLDPAGAARLLAGDLDGDGVDELVASGDDGAMRLYRNGQLAASRPVPGVISLRAVDATGDGWPEIVTASESGEVDVLDASLNVLRWTPADAGGIAATAGDVNGDGQPDIVRADGGGVSVFSSAGKSVLKLSSLAEDVLVTDVDGDGNADVLAVEPTSSIIEVLEGDGHGGFPGQRKTIGTQANGWYMQVADFNGDNRKDLAVSYIDGVVEGDLARTTKVMLGDGQGGYTASATLDHTGTTTGTAIGDVNGDGHPDVVTSDYHTGSVSEFLGNGDGTFLPRIPIPTCGFLDGVAAGDFNKDGFADAVAMCRPVDYPAQLHILLGSPGGLVKSPIVLPYGINWTSYVVRTGDINGDGNLDIAVGTLSSYCLTDPSCVNGFGTDHGRSITYFLGQGNGVFGLAQSYYPGGVFSDFSLADVTGDGRADIVAAMTFLDQVQIGAGKADGTIGTPTTAATPDYPLGLATGDVNGDGIADIVTSHYANVVSVLPGRGAGAFGNAWAYTSRSPSGDLAVLDANGDGKADVVTTHASSVEVFLQGT